jgi:hypothetical protein
MARDPIFKIPSVHLATFIVHYNCPNLEKWSKRKNNRDHWPYFKPTIRLGGDPQTQHLVCPACKTDIKVVQRTLHKKSVGIYH